jgi:hypothetical protein
MTKQVEFKAIFRVSRTWEYAEKAYSEYDDAFYYDHKTGYVDNDFDTLEEAEAFFDEQVREYPDYELDIVQVWQPVDETAIKGINLRHRDADGE